MPSTSSPLKLFRQVHLYLGVFISPAILFFAVTGALQTFSLHETTRGSDYKPPTWLVKLGQLHKKQTLDVPVRKPQLAFASGSAAPASGSGAATSSGSLQHSATPKVPEVPASSAPKSAKSSDATVPKQKNLLPMKLFFLLVSIGLVISTSTGIYMAYKFNRRKVWIGGLLLAGIVFPLLLLAF